MKTHLDFLRCNAMQMRCDAMRCEATQWDTMRRDMIRCDFKKALATLWCYCCCSTTSDWWSLPLAVARKLEYEVKRRSWSLLTIYLSSLDVSVIRRLKIKRQHGTFVAPISLELWDERLAINKLLFQNKWLLFQNKLPLNSSSNCSLKSFKQQKVQYLAINMQWSRKVKNIGGTSSNRWG